MEWRARFWEDSPLFETIRDAASLFAGHAAFPSPEDIDAVLLGRAPVRFVRKHQRDKALYDARIVCEGVVPTRAGSWHDLLNALVWATFPAAKMALHRRQHALVVPGAPRRTREQDALAMLDEGGVLLPGDGRRLVFGHAIYESLVARWRAPRGAGLRLAGKEPADVEAAARIADRSVLRSPSELERVLLAGLDPAGASDIRATP